MRQLSTEGLISCQFSFYPLGLADYLGPIEQALGVIRSSGLFFEIGAMSTIIKGPPAEVLAVVRQIAEQQADAGYIMNLTLSNVCGCQ